MKFAVTVFFASLSLLISFNAFGYYKDEVPVAVAPCSGSDQCPNPAYQQGPASNFRLSSSDNWDDQYGYVRGKPCGACSCVDPGYHWNTCINRTEYCEAFGNIGSMNS